MKTQVLDLLVEGVRVSVRIDERGRPLTVSTGAWLGGDAERIAKLAIKVAEAQIRRAAHSSNRTAASAKTRRDDARKHWSRDSLDEVHKLHPDYGAERLALAARKYILLNCEKKSPEYAKRHEITEYRAAQYLKAARSK